MYISQLFSDFFILKTAVGVYEYQLFCYVRTLVVHYICHYYQLCNAFKNKESVDRCAFLLYCQHRSVWGKYSDDSVYSNNDDGMCSGNTSSFLFVHL